MQAALPCSVKLELAHTSLNHCGCIRRIALSVSAGRGGSGERAELGWGTGPPLDHPLQPGPPAWEAYFGRSPHHCARRGRSADQR